MAKNVIHATISGDITPKHIADFTGRNSVGVGSMIKFATNTKAVTNLKREPKNTR